MSTRLNVAHSSLRRRIYSARAPHNSSSTHKVLPTTPRCRISTNLSLHLCSETSCPSGVKISPANQHCSFSESVYYTAQHYSSNLREKSRAAAKYLYCHAPLSTGTHSAFSTLAVPLSHKSTHPLKLIVARVLKFVFRSGAEIEFPQCPTRTPSHTCAPAYWQ